MGTIIVIAEIFILSAVAVVSAVVAWKLVDEIFAVARVVKQTYLDTAWKKYGYEQDDNGVRRPILKRDASNVTETDAHLAGYGAIALAIVFGLVSMGLLAMGGLLLLGV